MPIHYKTLGDFFPMYRESNNHVGTRDWKIFISRQRVNDGGVAATGDLKEVLVAPHNMVLADCYVVSMDGDIAPDAANYSAFSVFVRTNGVLRPGAAGTINTSLVGLTRYIPTQITRSATMSNTIIYTGDTVEVIMAKNALGVACNEILFALQFVAFQES